MHNYLHLYRQVILHSGTISHKTVTHSTAFSTQKSLIGKLDRTHHTDPSVS